MRHGIFGEAITRFTKGQPAALTAPVLAEAVRLIGDFTGAARASEDADIYPGRRDPVVLELSVANIQNVLGVRLSVDVIAKTLSDAEFKVVLEDDDMITVTTPFWRSDIHIVEDIIEEVGRLNGFDTISPTLPSRDFTAIRPASFDVLRARIRSILVRAGANEVLTYSFVHGDVLKKAGQDPAASYRLVNSISPELQYYRQSITPSLLGLVHPNVKNGFDSFALFELNKTHTKSADLVGGVPAEMHRLGLVVVGRHAEVGAPYYKAKWLLEYLGKALGLQLEYKPFPADTTLAFTKPFELKRSARIVDVRSNQSIGIVGEYKSSVVRDFKLPAFAAGFELLTEGVALALEHAMGEYAPLSKYPHTERDICFQVDQSVQYHAITDAAQQVLAQSSLATSLEPIDLYQPADSTAKNVTIRITFQSYNHTLAGDEVTKVLDAVIADVQEKTGAKVV
jgi:phenylalanyl-tRNA synthetase beta chain